MQQTRRAAPVRGKRKGFRRRDVLIFVGCLVGLLLSFQSDGEAFFKPGFVVMWGEDMHHEEVSRLPKPIITDLDGDGANDIITATAPETLCIMTNYRPSRAAGGYIQELAPRYTSRTSSLLIGLGAGYLEKAEKKPVPVVLIKKPEEKKQVQHIVTVSDDYLVTLFNHELKEQWVVRLPVPEPHDNYMYDEINEAEDLYEWFYPTHATVMVLPNQVYQEDMGLIIVGVEVQVPLNKEEDDDANIGSPVKQLSYFALNGKDGGLRWSHNSSDEIRQSQSAGTKFQHSYKLTLQHLEKHATDQDWRYFRNNIIAGLPHLHTHSHDVKMQLHRFAPKKNHKKKGADHSGHQTEAPVKYKTKDRRRSQNDYGALGDKVRNVLQWRHHRKERLPPNVVVVHRESGLEALHLYTGKSITQVGPLEPGVLYDDVNDDSIIDEVHAVISDKTNLDTYNRDWNSQKSVCDGVVFSGVPVGRKKVYNHSICQEGGMLHSFEFLRNILKHDEEEEGAVVNSLGGFEIPGFGGRDHFDELLTATAPITMHRHIHHIDKLTMYRTDIIFFISSGLVTCINGKTGKLRWHTDTDALFGAHANEGMMFAKLIGQHLGNQETALEAKHREKEKEIQGSFAHLKPYSLLTRTESDPQEDVVTIRNIYNVYPAQYILAVGFKNVVVLNSMNGHIENEFQIDSYPVAPSIVVDLDSDGTNDVLLITQKGLYAYLGKSRRGATVITATITCVMALLALLFLTHSQVQGPKVRRVHRSTD